MPNIALPERLPFSAVSAFLSACGFPPEQVRQCRILPRRVEIDVVDDGPRRLMAEHEVVFHTVRIPFDPLGPWPQDAQPQDAA